MKKQRIGVFETNSSSMHSLSLGKTKKRVCVVDTKEEIEKIVIGVGEYHWGPEKLTTWLEKADYLAVEASEEDEQGALLLEALKIGFPNMSFQLPSEKERGSIDHESVGTIWSELETLEDVYNVIFGDAVINVDNDNG